MSRTGLIAQSFTRDQHLRRGKVDVLWPCWLYSVSILVTNDSLNLFERAVVRLVAIGISNVADIADTLCLPDTSLPGFILSRLEKKKLVRAGTLTDDGRAQLQEASRGRHETVLMYQDGLGGKLLPHVCTGTPSFLLPNPKGGYFLKEIDNNKENILQDRFTLASHNKLAPPTAADVSHAIHEYENICRNVPYLNGPEPEFIHFVDNQAAIRVQPKPRGILLHCLCKLTQDARDILVDNPFGFDDSLPQLTAGLVTSRHAGNIKAYLLGMRPKSPAGGGIASVSISDFPEIDRDLEDMAKGVNGADYVRAACSALEHILKRILLDRRYDEGYKACADLLCNSGCPENLARLELAARNMEQDVDEESRDFLSVAPEEIAKAVRGKTALKPLFALNLFLATQVPHHPLESVLRSSPDRLKTVAILCRERNEAAHGADTAWQIGRADTNRARSLIQALLEAWRPKLAAALDMVIPTQVNNEDAESSLLEFFSPSVRSNLDVRLNESLISAERQFLAYGIEELATTDQRVSQACVVRLATLCQRALATAFGTVGEDDIVARAEKSAREAGFALRDGKMPQELTATGEKFVTAAAQEGGKTTLGGQCLAWLLLENAGKLAQCAASCPHLLVHVAELIRLRGHGNEEVPAREVALNRRHIYKDLNLLFGGKVDEQSE